MTYWSSLADQMDDVNHTEWEVEIRITRLKEHGAIGLQSLSRLQKRIQDVLIEDREDILR